MKQHHLSITTIIVTSCLIEFIVCIFHFDYIIIQSVGTGDLPSLPCLTENISQSQNTGIYK